VSREGALERWETKLVNTEATPAHRQGHQLLLGLKFHASDKANAIADSLETSSHSEGNLRRQAEAKGQAVDIDPASKNKTTRLKEINELRGTAKGTWNRWRHEWMPRHLPTKSLLHFD
jgi:hypothetical protein